MNMRLKAQIILHFGSQANFAVASGKDETVVSRIIQGRRVLSPDEQKDWARRLKCRPEDIFPTIQAVIPDTVMVPQQGPTTEAQGVV